MKNISFLESNGVDVTSSLDLFGDIDTYNDNINELVRSLTDKLQKLENYKNNKDLSNYSLYLHSLISDTRYFGFNKLADFASKQEVKSNLGDVNYIQDNFPLLKDEVKNVLIIIDDYLNDGNSSEEYIIPKIIPQEGEVYNTETILVVDDSNIIRNFVKRTFSDVYGVGTAKDGQEAINIINSNKDNNYISAILLDLNMPGVDGFEVLEYMKENDLLGTIPVSIISGDSSKATINRAFKYDIVDMLSKPFTEKSVKGILEKTLMYKEMK